MDKKKKCIIDEYKTVYGFSLFVIINPDKSIVDKRFSFRNDESSLVFFSLFITIISQSSPAILSYAPLTV